MVPFDRGGRFGVNAGKSRFPLDEIESSHLSRHHLNHLSNLIISNHRIVTEYLIKNMFVIIDNQKKTKKQETWKGY